MECLFETIQKFKVFSYLFLFDACAACFTYFRTKQPDNASWILDRWGTVTNGLECCQQHCSSNICVFVSSENLSSFLMVSYLSSCTTWLMIRNSSGTWSPFETENFLSIKQHFIYAKTWPNHANSCPKLLRGKKLLNVLNALLGLTRKNPLEKLFYLQKR